MPNIGGWNCKDIAEYNAQGPGRFWRCAEN